MKHPDKELYAVLREEVKELYEKVAPEPYHVDDAAYMLQINGAKELEHFMSVMKELTDSGILTTTDNQWYKLRIKETFKEGIYKRYRNSYGFVLSEEEADIFIPDEYRGTAMNNDKVNVRITQEGTGRKNPEGKIIEIIERANTKIVGTFEREKNFGFVVPDDERIGSDVYINLADAKGARSGAKVMVEVTKWPKEENRRPEGKISEILGYEGTPGLDINCIVASHNLPFSFPEEVDNEAKNIDTEIRIDKKRLDLRNDLLITIDGADAKDLDDAVSAHKLDNGNYALGVHIADVSHYVKSNGAIDQEAYGRGTSVYLADRVIPMLPKILSNGICSLNEKVERYAMSCLMEITPQGRVASFKIQPSIIKVARRCSYKEVYKALAEDVVPEDLEQCMPLLHDLYDVAKILHTMRVKRGALDFEVPEYKVVLDEKGIPLRIVKRERTFAERIIEECMLIANETVASYLERKENPSVYRIHEKPKEEKMDNVKRVLRYLGKEVKLNEDIHPKDYQKLLEEVKGTDVEQVAQTMILRSMQQAKYKVENLGHFGLASESYTHFTSPIRRYPDLMIHRLLKKAIGWRDGYTNANTNEKFLSAACEHSSKMEQVAVETEREVDDMKKAQYMESYIGHCFDGKVNSITSFGMFIELENGIDGLVPMATMDDDYYIFDEEHYLLVGRHSGKQFHLGQKVKVTLVNVDVQKGQIDFVLGDVDPAKIYRGKKVLPPKRKPVEILKPEEFAFKRFDKRRKGSSVSRKKLTKKQKNSKNKKKGKKRRR